MKTAARAGKMAKIAEATGISRDGAYKALKVGSKPQMTTILGLLNALGMIIKVVPKAADDNSYATIA